MPPEVAGWRGDTAVACVPPTDLGVACIFGRGATAVGFAPVPSRSGTSLTLPCPTRSGSSRVFCRVRGLARGSCQLPWSDIASLRSATSGLTASARKHATCAFLCPALMLHRAPAAAARAPSEAPSLTSLTTVSMAPSEMIRDCTSAPRCAIVASTHAALACASASSVPPPAALEITPLLSRAPPPPLAPPPPPPPPIAERFSISSSLGKP